MVLLKKLIVEETIKALPMKSGEVEEIREQVTVTQEITKEDKPRKTTKKKINFCFHCDA